MCLFLELGHHCALARLATVFLDPCHPPHFPGAAPVWCISPATPTRRPDSCWVTLDGHRWTWWIQPIRSVSGVKMNTYWDRRCLHEHCYVLCLTFKGSLLCVFHVLCFTPLYLPGGVAELASRVTCRWSETVHSARFRRAGFGKRCYFHAPLWWCCWRIRQESLLSLESREERKSRTADMVEEAGSRVEMRKM